MVGRLKPILASQGIDAWCSSSDLRAATNWEQQIRVALARSDWFVVVLSPAAQRSSWVQAETHWAVEHMPDRVIPLLTADCRPIDLHLRLGPLQYVDFQADFDLAAAELLALLESRDGSASTTSTVGHEDETHLVQRVCRAVLKVRIERLNAPDYEEHLEIRNSAIIGRAVQAHLRLEDDCVSRRHLRLQVLERAGRPELMAMDLESANGTFIDGERVIGAQPVAVGQVLRLGSLRLHLLELTALTAS